MMEIQISNFFRYYILCITGNLKCTIPDISPSITSPSLTGPTPAGVPVKTTSPRTKLALKFPKKILKEKLFIIPQQGNLK